MRDETGGGTRRSSDALDALRARRAAASGRPGPVPPSRGSRPKSPSRLLPIALAIAFAWAAAASYLAIDNHRVVVRLTDEQAALRVANDEKVRALTRRLVGVASHQVLEQDGLTDRLADIITRQVELENRLSTLSLIAERLTGGSTAPAAAQPLTPTGRSGAVEPPAGSERRSRLAETLARLPLSRQFTTLEGSLGRVAAAQVSTLDSFGLAVRSRVDAVRGVIAELGLQITPDPHAAVPPFLERQPAAPALADAFSRQLTRLASTLEDGERWTLLSDTLPLQVPLVIEGNTTSNFGTRKDPFTGAATMHPGMDFRSPVGTPAHATAVGRVISAEVRGGYGNMVEVDHGHDLTTRYAHLSAIQVGAGQMVGPGTVVGLVGSTGRSTGPHLHYETRIAGSAVDPARFIKAGAHLHGQPPLSGPAPSQPGADPPGADVPASEDGSDD